MGPNIKDPIAREIDELITPNHIIQLSASDDFLNNRIKMIPEEQVLAGLHYSEQDMARRLDTYRKANEAPNGDPSICDFFVEYKNDEIEIQDTSIESTAVSETLQT